MPDYEVYCLRDNPFPENPLVDPYSNDIRLNGSIFCESISSKEITQLRQKLSESLNLIYASGYKFVRGIGKSAIIVHEWRRLKQEPGTTSVYVRCGKTDKPADFCGDIMKNWHAEGYLWRSFERLLSLYSTQSQDIRLTPESVETMFRAYLTPPDQLPLTLYTHYTSAGALAENFSGWLAKNTGLSKEILYNWALIYLTNPSEFTKFCSARTRNVDRIELIGQLLRVLITAQFGRHYIFLDQLEDTIMTLPTGRIGDFCLDMRRFLEKMAGKAVTVCTLHPDSEEKLDTPAAKHLTSLAPLDTIHRVDVIELEAAGEEALLLAAEYLKRFRMSEPPSQIYPFEPDALRYLCFLKQGNKREFLALLCSCLKYGATSGAEKITLDLILQHPRETIGQVVDPRNLTKFKQEVMKSGEEGSN